MRGLKSTRPDLVNLQELGHSGLGREMYGLTISKDRKPAKKGKGQALRGGAKLGFVILGAQHAREVRILLVIVPFAELLCAHTRHTSGSRHPPRSTFHMH